MERGAAQRLSASELDRLQRSQLTQVMDKVAKTLGDIYDKTD